MPIPLYLPLQPSDVANRPHDCPAWLHSQRYQLRSPLRGRLSPPVPPAGMFVATVSSDPVPVLTTPFEWPDSVSVRPASMLPPLSPVTPERLMHSQRLADQQPGSRRLREPHRHLLRVRLSRRSIQNLSPPVPPLTEPAYRVIRLVRRPSLSQLRSEPVSTLA